MIVEGCYIPFDWAKDFSEAYISHIRYLCLILSKTYIENHFEKIVKYGSIIQSRLDDSGLSKEELMEENEQNLLLCEKYGCHYVLIEETYDLDAIAGRI